MPNPIPVTVLTGFLGAGKPTLLNRILTENHGKKLAVIENEFGEVGVDNQLVISGDEELFEMNNGCICCTVRGDLIRILGRLIKRKDRLDGILIETTGLANPAPVAQTFFTDDEMKQNFKLDAIITVVDAKHVIQHLDADDESVKQLAFADVILLNKTDLVSAGELGALEKRIHGINAVAKIHRSKDCDVPLDRVLDVGGFNLGLLMRTAIGVGTPRGLQGLLGAYVTLIVALWTSLIDRTAHAGPHGERGTIRHRLELLPITGL
jgi:G3E family GTPase